MTSESLFQEAGKMLPTWPATVLPSWVKTTRLPKLGAGFMSLGPR